jgi:3-methyladenine DNA glycosylase AlkD
MVSQTAYIQQQLRRMADPQRAAVTRRFFKTGPGQYGHGDRFIGIKVPHLRRLAREHSGIDPAAAAELLRSPIHEERLTALLIWTCQYDGADERTRTAIYNLYLDHTAWINNWDLVDATAPNIVGDYLLDRDKAPLDRLARSGSLWERRIGIVATWAFIRKGRFDDTLRLADDLRGDAHDLIHKAVGWMLREVGNRDRGCLEDYLRPRYRELPRTLLRYAIEKLPEERRQDYLKGRVP